MAFEQRARIAENLQRFIFCHAAKIKSKVKTSKLKFSKTVARAVCLRQTCGMAGIGKKIDSLRLNRLERERLILAVALSLAAHLAAFGFYEFSKGLHLFSWLHHAAKFKAQPLQPLAQNSEPVIFVDVNPEQATTEAPQNAKYYSSKNSQAANPETERNTDTPKLNGKQTDVPKTEDAPRQNLNKLQPQPPEKEQPEPKPVVKPGDLALAKPQELQPQQPPRPRTIREALAQQNRLPGVQMRQDGGVQRHSIVPSFDVKLTGFGDYDERFYQAVSQHWWDLLDSQQFARDRTGKVVLQFHLNYDGTITDMKVVQNDVGELLGYVCQKAVFDPAPFERFPNDMREKLGDYASIQFTFFY
jgi:outer membrane biosynthesis protein TonB